MTDSSTTPASRAAPGGTTTARPAVGWRAELGLLTVVLIWGLNFSVMKSALGGTDPFVFNALRFTLTVLFLGLWARLAPDAPDAKLAPPPRRLGLRVALLGLGGHGIYQSLFVLGLSKTSSGNSALIIASSPLWTAWIAHLFGIERIRAGAWLGLVVAFAGTALLVTLGARDDGGPATLAGDLLTLGAAAAWGAHTVFSKPLVPRLGAVALTWRTTLVALPLLWLLALPRLDGSSLDLPPSTWGAVVFAGVLSTGLSYVLWNRSIRRVGASQTAVAANLVPVLALACGALFLGESVTAGQVACGACILLGILQMRRAR